MDRLIECIPQITDLKVKILILSITLVSAFFLVSMMWKHYKALPKLTIFLCICGVIIITMLSYSKDFKNSSTFGWLNDLKFWGINWDYSGYFLGMSAVSGADIHISSFQLKGRNNSQKPILKISGLLRSNVTNEEIPILLESMPPEKTRGIPPKCEFWIRALFRDPNAKREGLPEEKFVKQFSDFTLIFKYDNKVYDHRFREKDVKKVIEKFRKASNPAPRPMVTRKDEEE